MLHNIQHEIVPNKNSMQLSVSCNHFNIKQCHTKAFDKALAARGLDTPEEIDTQTYHEKIVHRLTKRYFLRNIVIDSPHRGFALPATSR